MWNTSKENLGFVNFSHHFLTGFDQMHDVFPWPRLGILDLKSNLLQGPLPIPPPSTFIYLVSNNMLSGKVSSLICSLNSLYALDLSHNHLSDTLPPCLGNFSSFLSILNLRSNNFQGMIPQVCTRKSSLKMLDLSENQLEGWLPRSMANCAMLEFLILGNNRLHDVFPYWLGKLPVLKVLILRSNRFHGDMGSPATNFEFQKLRILDLSSNNFRGKLPLGYFKNWIAMKNVPKEHLTYMQAIATIYLLGFALNENYDYSMTITNKGVKTVYAKILDFFTAVDLSCNKFEGGIPEVIGDLKALHLLNLSSNFLTDCIPSSLGNLHQLESLDLSQNMLSREIPQQLTEFIFLEFFNVSYNNVTGPIPQGKQFNTFQMSSFEGNLGLCGDQISRKCGDHSRSLAPPPIFEEAHRSESLFDFNWKAILLGYGCGLIIGEIIGHIMTTRKHDWFMKNFENRQHQRERSARRRGSRN